MCNFRTLCLFFVIQFNVEMFSNFDVVFLDYNYFTELASPIAYILAIFQPNPLKFSVIHHNIALHVIASINW